METKTEADSTDITEHPHDDKSRPYVCTVCDKRFTKRCNMTEHRKRHTGDNVYSCTQCDKRFSTADALRKHKNIHTSKYKCTECDKCCQSDKALAVHRRSHSGEKLFECTVCSKRFTQAGNLTTHSRIHSGEKPHKCHLCDNAFSQSGHLTTHMRVHTGEKPYKCSLCDRSFSQSNHLETHKRRVHSNRRPYYCPYCGKLFKTNIELQCHVRIHTGAKPCSCRHCSERFTCHTMKVLGWHVAFVRRSSATVVTLRNIYVDMKVWRRMFAVNVQSDSVQQLNWKLISWYTWATNSFVVVHVVNISDINILLKVTLEGVMISWDFSVFSLLVFVTFASFWLCDAGLYVDCRL